MGRKRVRQERTARDDPSRSTRQLIWDHCKDVLALLGCEFLLFEILQLAVILMPDSLPLVQKCRSVLEWGAVATISYLIVESIVRMGLRQSLEMLRELERSRRGENVE